MLTPAFFHFPIMASESTEDDHVAEVVMPEAAWQSLQKRAFTAWLNQYLGKRGMSLKDPVQDLDNGVLLSVFLELILDKPLPCKIDLAPKIRIQRIDNMTQVLSYMKNVLDMKLVNVSAEDFVDHNPKIVLGTLYALYKRFMIKTIETSGKTAEEALLEWVRLKTASYDGVKIESYKHSFNDGRIFLALCDGYIDDKTIFDYDTAVTSNPTDNLARAFAVAEEKLGVPRILEPSDLGEGVTDERGVIIALSTYFHAFKLGEKERENARTVRDLQKQLKATSVHLEETTEELEKLRRELEDQRAKVQPREIWSKYRENPGANEPPSITIPFSVEEQALTKRFTMYHIKVAMLNKIWVVKRRYSEFDRLNDRLIKELGRSKVNVKLPPKRVVGNMNMEFIESRRIGLNNFLHEIVTSHPELANSDAFADFISKDSVTTLIDQATFKKRQLEKFAKIEKSAKTSEDAEHHDILSSDEESGV